MEREDPDPSLKLGDYEVIEQIEGGSFSAKFLVLHNIENKKYLLRKINLSTQKDKFKRTAQQEVDLLAKLRHPYIVEYKDAWVDAENHVYIVADYCERGDMSQTIRRARGAYFPEELVCKWLTQMLLAINYLHSNRVHHRDLKLSNIHVTKENDIRLGDFGLSKFLDEENFPCSADYITPELISGAPYSYKSDIWSLGCCIFEIAARQQAFKASDMTGLVNKINRSLISPLPIIYSPNLKQIIKSMLRKSPEHRPTAAELLRQLHLQPFLLRCHNPSPTFLPVKSPSPKSANDKKVKTPSSSGSKNSRHRQVKPTQKELLPFFDEIKNVHVPSLLDAELSIDDVLKTKRVDPTSYSGKISTDSEDSKSGDTVFDTSAGNGDDDSNACSSSVKETTPPMKDMNAKKLADSEECDQKNEAIADSKRRFDSPGFRDELEPAIELWNETMSSTQSNGASETGTGDETKADQETPKLVLLLPPKATEDGEDSKSNNEKPAPQRADALESLLELCADLLKQDKLDELTGILKPFGDEMVSSRETAIWLTKSLMNAKKMTKDS